MQILLTQQFKGTWPPCDHLECVAGSDIDEPAGVLGPDYEG